LRPANCIYSPQFIIGINNIADNAEEASCAMEEQRFSIFRARTRRGSPSLHSRLSVWQKYWLVAHRRYVTARLMQSIFPLPVLKAPRNKPWAPSPSPICRIVITVRLLSNSTLRRMPARQHTATIGEEDESPRSDIPQFAYRAVIPFRHRARETRIAAGDRAVSHYALLKH